MLDGVETTHDASRLARHDAFVAVNTALQMDLAGQVNVEAVDGDRIAGIGGHADYALGASRCPGGLSIIAMASTSRGRSTLVERLDAPTTTPRSDIDLVVTEHGCADLRGLDDSARAVALRVLFPDFESATPLESA
jgi:acyl-CoA hydrolase